MSFARALLRAAQPLVPASPYGLTVLAYHLVAAGTGSPVDVPAADFRAQMKGLARRGGVVGLPEAERYLRSGGEDSGDVDGGPLVVLTFDDAYHNFFTDAWPVLRDLGLPATLYVPTAFVAGGPPPLAVAGDLPPASWDELAEARDDGKGLLTLGSHGHSHRELPALSESEIAADLERARELLQERTGSAAEHFCYPRALWNSRTEAVVGLLHNTAAVAGGRINRPRRQTTSHIRLHRVPVRRDLGPDLDPVLRRAVWLEEWIANGVRRPRAAWRRRTRPSPDGGDATAGRATVPLTQPPRLLYLTTHGMTLRLLARGQLRHLRRERGWEVSAAAAPGADLEGAARQEGVGVTPIPTLRREISPGADLAALWRLYRLMRRRRPDLVVAGTPKAGLLGVLAARLAGVPRAVYVLRGLRLETATGWRRWVLAATERAAARLAHRVLCVSPSLARRHAELGLAPAHRLTVPGAGSSNGVDVELFRPAQADTHGADPEAVSALLPAGGPVIGFVGRFTRDKGMAELTEAWFGRLRERFPEARLLLLGEWEEGDPVDGEIRRRLEEDHRVVRPGFVADTAPWYRAMDVLAFPSHREGFPNAPLEAAASGVPVAGFAATGTVDAVEDGVTGTLVPVGDAAALAAALAAYLEDPELRRRHGEAGRRRAVERYANHRVWQAWTDIYAGELAAAGIPAPDAEDDAGAAAGEPGATGRPPRRPHRLYRSFGKRLFDLALTLPALVLLSPLIWALALLVRLFLGSPVLFRQTRPGRGGEPFTLLKFRTMTDETNDAGDLLPDARRLTRFGRFLRRTSLDELPELVNVVRGDMSLVGPRPLLMRYLERYTPRQAQRHQVRPGITGWAVIHGRNALSWEEKLERDAEYVERVSPALDLKILAATLRMVATGAGVSAAGHSTMPEYTGPPTDEETDG